MGIILNVTLKSLGEVTGTIIKKSDGSKVKRHSSSIIPLLSLSEPTPCNVSDNTFDPGDNVYTSIDPPSKICRKAAVICKLKNKS